MDVAFLTLQRLLAGRFSLERELGRGGMGVVYLGRDILLDRQVAIKVLPPNLVGGEELRERFLREARTAAQLQHPGIVPVHSVEVFEEWIIICMAYVDGGTLGDRVRERGPLSHDHATGILRDIALALAYAHRRGVVHRDIKPENILLDRESGRAMLADFGIAQVAATTELTGAGKLLGTPAYMSPEQIGGSRADGRSDLYSLGMVGYYCIAGRLPFEGDARSLLAQQLTREPPSLTSFSDDVPPRLAQSVERCLAKDPAVRYQSGEALADALDKLTEKRGELPRSIAAWMGSPTELTLSQTAVAPLLVVGVWFALDFFLNPLFGPSGSQVFDAEVGFNIGLVAPPILYFLRRAFLLRRVRASGYGVEELRAALVASSRATTSGRAGRLSTIAAPLRRLLLGGALGLVMGMIIAMPGVAARTWDDKVFFGYLSAATFGAAIWGAYGLMRRGRDLARDLRGWFWNSRASGWLTALVGVGQRKRRLSTELGNRQTELALGSAALALYEALPKALRQSLDELPDAIRQLEEVAQAQRARIEILNQVNATPPHALSSGNAPDELEQRRALTQLETNQAREEAERRLRNAVAALEMFRLDLLRLHAQGASITADLEIVTEMSARMKHEAAGLADVERLLASPRVSAGSPAAI